MRKIKVSFLQVVIILFSATVMITSCSNNEKEIQIEEAIVENLNTSTNRQLIRDLFTKGTSLNKQLENLSKNQQFSGNSNDEINADELLIEYQECAECPAAYRNFLIPLFREIKDMNYESDVISKIEEYELMLAQSNLSEINKDNLKFILFSFKEAAVYALENPDITNRNASKGGCGKALGQGLVSGFVAGCIRGGIIGATAGTVTVPVIGTVTGAVGGCIANGAVTGVISGFASWLWCAIK